MPHILGEPWCLQGALALEQASKLPACARWGDATSPISGLGSFPFLSAKRDEDLLCVCGCMCTCV